MRYVLRTLLLLAAMTAGLELLCRYAIGRVPRLRVDSRFDKITRPDELVVQSFEGFSRGSTNELGHLDAPMPATLPTDAILILGDSFTEARQVDRSERYTDLLGQALARRVYNAGHAGWSPLNALGYLRAEGERFAARTVVVQVSGNDLDDVISRKRARVIERSDGTLAIEWPRRSSGSRIRELALKSAFAGQLVQSTAGILGGGGDDEAAKATSCQFPSGEAVRALSWAFQELAREHPDVRVLYLPRLAYHGFCRDECEVARVFVTRSARVAGVPVVDPTEEMCMEFERTRQPLHGFVNTIPGTGHLNARGHEIVAVELERELGR